MSPDFGLPLPGECQYPPHSEDCFTTVDRLCRECDWLLGPFPLSKRRKVWSEHQRKRQGLPEALPDKFLERLAADMFANPQLFAAIIQDLNNYKGES